MRTDQNDARRRTGGPDKERTLQGPKAWSLEEIRAALQRCYDSMLALCGDLGDADWKVQSLCPAWTVRDVVNHVTSIEAVMAGWLPEDDRTPPPFDRAAEFMRGTDVDPRSYVDLVRAVYDGRRRDLAALSDADLQRPSWTPVGPGTFGRFLAIRVFDFWVHERDITTPLGRATDDTGIGAEIALAEVENSIGYIVGKKVGVPDGKAITFDLTGPIVRELHVAVDGRARQVEELADPDVTLTTDSTTFIQLACGRIDPQVPISSGAVTWTGDDELGDRAARSLRFTM
ncbi:maleylpyruvate isomerase family mycothiol-dependent enzyme [Mycobacterium bohemicum]|uniref:maleylpyruvate isomerase family mycothiol-dependent enzyme n=1 Tax=Mycobacterium bohemicum TaxID=56425 RepID=UPI001FE3C0F3|nr:maleylpyruvate isomerase family mycothiol-dependent enzyme [Mycobacterium bohemicum]